MLSSADFAPAQPISDPQHSRQPAMVQSSPPAAAQPAQPTGVTLSCRPDRAGNKLIFPYTLTNHGAADIYVMDAIYAADPTTGRQALDRQAPVIWLGGDGFAHVLKGIAPLPPDRLVNVRVIPLAAKLAPNATLTRSLEVQLPLAETDPYHPGPAAARVRIDRHPGRRADDRIPAQHGRGIWRRAGSRRARSLPRSGQAYRRTDRARVLRLSIPATADPETHG